MLVFYNADETACVTGDSIKAFSVVTINESTYKIKANIGDGVEHILGSYSTFERARDVMHSLVDMLIYDKYRFEKEYSEVKGTPYEAQFLEEEVKNCVKTLPKE